MNNNEDENKKNKFNVFKVLIIDDDPEVLKVIQEFISRRYDVKVFLGTNGVEGLWKASNDEFDLMVVDLKMPKVDGISFFKAYTASKHFKGSEKFVVVSGNIEREHLSYLIELKAKVVVKPFTEKEIFGVLDQLNVPMLKGF